MSGRAFWNATTISSSANFKSDAAATVTAVSAGRVSSDRARAKAAPRNQQRTECIFPIIPANSKQRDVPQLYLVCRKMRLTCGTSLSVLWLFQSQAHSLFHPFDSRKPVEPRIEAHDPLDSLLLHHGEMDGIARRQPFVSEHDLFRPLGGRHIYRENLVHNAEERIESGLDGIPPLNGDVPMQDLLEYFGVRDQTLALGNALFQKLLSVGLVRVRRAYQIHRYVGVDEDHLSSMPL